MLRGSPQEFWHNILYRTSRRAVAERLCDASCLSVVQIFITDIIASASGLYHVLES